MEAGLRLKNVREKLGLRFREVEQASHVIAKRRGNSDFIIGLSRLADIENRGVVPNIHRLYCLCAIYRLDIDEVLAWYGIRTEEIWRDAAHVKPAKTHLIQAREPTRGSVSLPIHLDPGVDFRETVFLSRVVREWGRLPLSLLGALDIEKTRYGVVGYEDRRMYPLLQPGALVQIDDMRTEIREEGWTTEFDRPIYFLELRHSYACCWCSLSGDHLILQPHPGSPVKPEVLDFESEVDVIGEVVAIAMQLETSPTRRKVKRRARSATSPK